LSHVTYKARDAAKRGRNVKTFVQVLTGIKSEDEFGYSDTSDNASKYADDIADESSEWGRRYLRRERQPTWTWRSLRDRFLEEKLPKLKAGYRKEYERYLQLPEFAQIEDITIGDLRIIDLDPIRDKMLKAYARSTVNRAIKQSREMLTWA